MKKGIIESKNQHQYGQAGMKIMTLGLKVKIELLLKDQKLDDFLKEIHIGRKTFNEIWTKRPNDKVYASIAEYFGLDIDELLKLPITREEILTMTDEELANRDGSAYDIIEEAYFSEWFMTDIKNEIKEYIQLNKDDRQRQINELRDKIKEIREDDTVDGVSQHELTLLRRKFNTKSKLDNEETISETSQNEVYAEQPYEQNQEQSYEQNHYGYE